MTGEAGRWNSPIALAAAVLLRLVGIGVAVAGLGEESREVLLSSGRAVSEASMITVSVLVRASH